MSEDPSSILAKTARGTGWVVAWRMITRSLGLVSTLALVRLLAPADFGLVTLAYSFSVSIESLSWIGIEEGVIRHPDPSPALYNTAFTISVLRGAAIGLLIAACAYPGALFFDEPRLTAVVLALALAAFIETLTNIGVVEFRRDFTFQKEFRLWLLPRIISIVVAIGVAAVFHTYWALVAGILTNQSLRATLSYAMHPYRPRLALSEWRQLTSYSAWNSLIAALGVLRDRSDTILIGRLLDTTHVGYYAVGYEIAELPSSELIAPLTRAAFTGFAAAQRSDVDAGQTWLRLVAAMGLLTLPAGVGVSAVAHPLIALAFGPGWTQAVVVVQVLGLAFCLTVFGMVSQTLFLAHGRMRTSVSITLASITVRVALLAALIPLYGLAGAALAAAVGIATEQILSGAFAMRGLGLGLGDLLARVWRCLGATGVMAGVLFWAGLGWSGTPAGDVMGRVLELGMTAGLGALVYGVTLAALWLASRRPVGPERDVLMLGRRVLGRRVLGRG